MSTLGDGDATGPERSKSQAEREGAGPADGEPVADTEEDRLRDPLDLNEVSDAARTHYGLSDEDVSAILEVTHELREKIIDAIHDGIVELEDRQGAARAFVFRANPALRKAFEEEMQERLAKLVNAEFAHDAISAFKWSPGFLKAGGMDIVFYINPDNPDNTSTVESIRFEIWNSELGARASHWEGSPERFARMYQLDFAEVLGVGGEKDQSGIQPE